MLPRSAVSPRKGNIVIKVIRDAAGKPVRFEAKFSDPRLTAQLSDLGTHTPHCAGQLAYGVPIGTGPVWRICTFCGGDGTLFDSHTTADAHVLSHLAR